MKYTRNALGLLNAQYRSVLKKCLLINLGLFALGAGAANAEDYSLKAEDLSTSKNITWKEIGADEYEADNPNMLKVELSADKTQYFEYTYTKPEGGTVYNERQEGKEGALTGDITADFKDITSNDDSVALVNANGNTLNITGDFLNNKSQGTSGYYYGGAVSNAGSLSIIGDVIGNGIINKLGAYGGVISNYNTGKISEITGNYIGNYLVSNTNTAYGGAILNYNKAEIGKIEGKFISNHAISNLIGTKVGAEGGAIMNLGSTIKSITGEFINNYVKNVSGSNSSSGSAYGGAINNVDGAVIGKIEGKFIGNYAIGNLNRDGYAGAQGGAISNESSTIKSITGEFINNYVKNVSGSGGALGGAIVNRETNGIIGNIEAVFINNYSINLEGVARGGAIFNLRSTIRNITGDFSGNYAQSANNASEGGAVMNLRSTINEIKGNFTNNYSLGYGRTSGGAVNNNDLGIISSITGDFESNYAESNGGAGAARGGALLNLGNITNLAANFNHNYALTNGTFAIGGAVANNYWNENSKGIGTLSGNFSNNYAKTTGAGYDAYAQGGAIYNSGQMNIDDIQSSTFSGNYVSGASEKTDGGAVWNAGTIGFSGKTVFKDNYKIVNGVKTANDIYNSGTVNVAENGSLDISGGITGDGNGKINLSQNAALNLNNATSAGNNLTLEKDATLAFNVNEINTSSTTQKGGKVDGDIKLNADSNLKVSTYVEHGVVNGEGTYKFANTVDTANGKWKLNTIIANSLYNYDFKLNDENNTLILEFAKKNADEIAKEFDTDKDKADEILAIASPKSGNYQFNRISETVNKQAQDGDSSLTSALDDLNDNTQANLETGRYIGDIIAKNVADRLNTRPDKNSVYGLSGGDAAEYEPEVWANAVYQAAENSGDLDYSADTKGVIAAVDGKANKNWTVGAGYAYLQTDLDSGAKSSDIDDHTVFAYTEYGRNSWFANGLAAYHWLSFDQNKKAFGENIKGSFDMQMLGLQALVGREFYGCADEHVLRLRPQTGLRYYKISQDDYTDSAGMKYNSADSDILTGVLGVSLTDETEVNGYKVMPKAFVNATYDLQNDDNTTIVHLPNGGSYAIAQESNGKFGVETGIGMEMKVSENAKVGLTYEYDWHDDYSAHTGLLNLKYAF